MARYKADIYAKNVFEINYDNLKLSGIKLICFDLDNTLDFPDQKKFELTPGIEGLLKKVEQEFDIYIVSNNAYEERVKEFADYFGYEYRHSMHKPFQKKYKEDQKINKYNKDEIVFIGDKIITDIIGANKFGSKSILVDPLYSENKVWYAIVMDILEGCYRSLVRFPKGKYYE